MAMHRAHKLTGLAVLLLMAASGLSRGADRPPEMAILEQKSHGPLALQLALRDVWKPAEKTLTIPVMDTPQSLTLQAPALPIPKEKVAVMRFQMRMATTSGYGGWNNFLQVRVNGQLLGPTTKDGLPRLINRKGPTVKTSSPDYPQEPYFKSVAGQANGLLTVFGPNWEEIEPRFISDRQELCWFALDISDVVKPDAPNQIVFTSIAQASMFKKTPAELKDNPLLIDSLEIGLADEAACNELVGNIAAQMAAFKPLVSASQGGIELAASAGGALRIRYNGDDYYLRSSYSEPGATVRTNRSGWTAEGWKVTVAPAGDNGLTLTGTAPSYEITRKVTIDGPFLRIRDSIHNTLAEDLGVMILHEMSISKPGTGWRLCGVPDIPVETDSAYNPTLHLSGAHSGLGAAMKDSVMRAQLVCSGSRQTVSYANDHVGMAPGDTYTCEWSLYVGGPDFWEFINALRRDWGVNHIIPGMWGFWSVGPGREPETSLFKDPAKLRAYLERKHMDIFTITPWFEYYNPPADWSPRSVYKNTAQDAMAKLKAANPNAKVLACTESFLYYVPEDFFKGTLPKFWTDAKGVNVPKNLATHTYELDEAATKVVDATPWHDSVFRTKNGHVEIDLNYCEKYRDGGCNLKLYPTLDNYWNKKFLSMLDFLVNDCGLDGVYIDSFSYPQASYDRWDGRTVDIALNTGRITRKYARLSLLTAAARRGWVEYCASRGKIVYINGKPDTAETQDLPCIGFLEGEWDYDPYAAKLDCPRAAQAQLSAPMILGVRPVRYPNYEAHYAEIIQGAVIAYLRYGALCCHYNTQIPEPGQPGGGEYGILNEMYPFTPVELHEGWVVGKERIITTVSRTFQWPHPEKPICKRFDLRGMPVEGGFDFTQNAQGWEVKVSLKDWKETAVIKGAE